MQDLPGALSCFSETFDMIKISKDLYIDEKDIQVDFVRASGPGGQKVNKTSSAVQLRYDTRSADLPENVRARLRQLAGKRVNEEGVLVIEASRFRTQEKNRQDAIDRLVSLVRKAAKKPKQRVETIVPRKAKERRLKAKRLKAEKKQLRKRVSIKDER